MENNTEPNQTQTPNSSSFDAKTTSWVAYLTWIGFIIAICAGDKEGAKFHLISLLDFRINSSYQPRRKRSSTIRKNKNFKIITVAIVISNNCFLFAYIYFFCK